MRLIRWFLRRSGPCNRCGAAIVIGIRTTTIEKGRLGASGDFCHRCFVAMSKQAERAGDEMAKKVSAEMARFRKGVKQAFDVFHPESDDVDKITEQLREALKHPKPGQN